MKNEFQEVKTRDRPIISQWKSPNKTQTQQARKPALSSCQCPARLPAPSFRLKSYLDLFGFRLEETGHKENSKEDKEDKLPEKEKIKEMPRSYIVLA